MLCASTITLSKSWPPEVPDRRGDEIAAIHRAAKGLRWIIPAARSRKPSILPRQAHRMDFGEVAVADSGSPS